MEKISLARFSTIAFVWGGTGWHVTPIISLVQQHKNQRLKYAWLGGSDSLEEREAKRERIEFFPIATMRRWSLFSPMTLLYPFVILKGIYDARKVLVKVKPDLVFSKWGPGSLSVGIASWLLMIPLWIHESDTVPGMASQLLGMIAERVYLGFDSARKFYRDKKCYLVWQIINPDLYIEPKTFHYWKTTKNHVLVVCGSQWSKNIFDSIIKSCKYLDVEWIVLLGTLNQDARERFQEFQSISLYDWIDPHTFASILKNTQLLITRGSATTLAESDIFKVRKLIIPLPWSSMNHQYYNAKWYKENRDDILLEEENIKELANIITKTLSTDIIERTMERDSNFMK